MDEHKYWDNNVHIFKQTQSEKVTFQAAMKLIVWLGGAVVRALRVATERLQVQIQATALSTGTL